MHDEASGGTEAGLARGSVTTGLVTLLDGRIGCNAISVIVCNSCSHPPPLPTGCVAMFSIISILEVLGILIVTVCTNAPQTACSVSLEVPACIFFGRVHHAEALRCSMAARLGLSV